MRDSRATYNTASRETLALILAGGNGTRLQGLTRSRAKPAVHFGTRHRIIDFPLSNCVNSRLGRIVLLTQYQSESLIEHVKCNWEARRDFGVSIEIWPAQQSKSRRWYMGTADAVYQNRDRIEALAPDNVLVVASDHVYAMDYTEMCAVHRRKDADVTISCVQVPISESHAFGIVEIDDDSRIRAFIEKPDWPVVAALDEQRPTAVASMGIYLFDTAYLLDCLEADAVDPDSRHDFGYSLIPRIMADADVYAYMFQNGAGEPGYWRDVGTIDSYWLAHQDLLSSSSKLDPENAAWPILGARSSSAPPRLASTANVIGSKLSSGCAVAGTVERSVLSANCRIGKGSVVSSSVLLPRAMIGPNCVLDSVIVDSDCEVPDNTVIHAAAVRSSDRFHVSPQGVVLVTQEALELYEAAPRRRIA